MKTVARNAPDLFHQHSCNLTSTNLTLSNSPNIEDNSSLLKWRLTVVRFCAMKSTSFPKMTPNKCSLKTSSFSCSLTYALTIPPEPLLICVHNNLFTQFLSHTKREFKQVGCLKESLRAVSISLCVCVCLKSTNKVITEIIFQYRILYSIGYLLIRLDVNM